MSKLLIYGSTTDPHTKPVVEFLENDGIEVHYFDLKRDAGVKSSEANTIIITNKRDGSKKRGEVRN